ncbi:MAG: hypothetical protein GC162_02310 [Planctomycetes bacterium]|nr:hypothetical protein [Planctomycetota bacterium]
MRVHVGIGWVAGMLLMASASVHAADAPAAERTLMAHRLGQLARIALSGQAQPGAAQIAVARTLLDQAVRLDPADVETARLNLEAAGLVSGADATKAALAAYLRTDPNNDAAQLQLVRLMIQGAQTAEQRRTLCDNLLTGPGAAQLSRPLRSRIALAAALLDAEQGKTKSQVDMLKTALSLDETNKSACLAVLTYLRDRGAGHIEQAQALLTLLAADPTDAGVQAQLGAMLLECGSPALAAGWFQSASVLYQLGAPPQGAQLIDFVSQWAMALWGAGEPEKAVQLIETFVGRDKDPSAAMPVALASILVAIHQSRDEKDAADEDFGKLLATLVKIAGNDRSDVVAMSDVVWAHLLFNKGSDQIAQMMQRLSEKADVKSVTYRRLAAWQLLRTGKREEAIKALDELAPTDLASALGRTYLESDDVDAATRLAHLNAVYARSPGSLIGQIAASKIRHLGGRPQVDDEAQSIARLAQQVPDTFRNLADPAGRLVRLQLETTEARYSYAQPIEVNVTVTNSAPIPLSLGRGASINGSVFLIPLVTINNGLPRYLPPQVIDLNRRLRLDPGQSLTVRSRVDVTELGEVLSDPAASITMRFTAVLNPMMTGEGKYAPGVLGAAAASRLSLRPAADLSDAAIDELLASPSLPQAALLMRAASALPKERAAEATKIMQSLSTMFETADPVRRAWLISYIAPNEAGRSLFKSMIDLAAKSDDPLVLEAMLVSQVDTVEDPLLGAAWSDPAVKQFASDIRQLLVDRADLIKKAAQAAAAAKPDASAAPAVAPAAGPVKPAVGPVTTPTGADAAPAAPR